MRWLKKWTKSHVYLCQHCGYFFIAYDFKQFFIFTEIMTSSFIIFNFQGSKNSVKKNWKEPIPTIYFSQCSDLLAKKQFPYRFRLSTAAVSTGQDRATIYTNILVLLYLSRNQGWDMIALCGWKFPDTTVHCTVSTR